MLTETGDSAACKTCKDRKHYPNSGMHPSSGRHLGNVRHPQCGRHPRQRLYTQQRPALWLRKQSAAVWPSD